MSLTLDDIQTALAMPPLGERSDFDLNPDIKAPAPERLKTLLVLMTPMKRQTIRICI
jgi:hypothetical protein